MRLRPVAAGALMALTLAGCSVDIHLPLARPGASPSGAAGALTRFYQQKLAWRSCGGGFQCTILRVPLDYGRPAADTIAIAVVRRPAGDPERRLGSLVLNPGGPGGSGIDYARAAADVLSPALLKQYDAVGFDPRGVGQSSPVTCLDDRQMDTFVATVPDPQTPAEQEEVVTQARRFASECQARSGKLLPHIGTPDAARDMDVLRQALGDRRLTYLGKSYGTYLGATYAELFPARVGRLVLDGALDPRMGSTQVGHDQAAGMQMELRAFLADCARRSDCPLGADAAAAERTLGGMLAAIRSRPLRGDASRMLDLALAEIGIIAALYSQAAWPVLRLALRLALLGDGRGLLQLADSYDDRGPDGHYRSNELTANIAVNCLDRPEVTSVAEIQARLPSFQEASPIFGAALAWSDLTCAFWPVRGTNRPHAISARGAARILVVGTIRDPATPYAWAQGLAGQLSSASLLTYDADGHTAYRRGSDCVDTAVDEYLLRGTSPPADTRCQ